MDSFSITQYGKPLDKSLYCIDIKNRVFSTNESNLVLDFTDIWTFITGDTCTFKTGNSCTFKTESHCTFNTGWECTFDVQGDCTFSTGHDCIFHVSCNCTFDTARSCIFSILDINTHKFNTWDDISIILDRADDKRYVLNKALIDMMKVIHG